MNSVLSIAANLFSKAAEELPRVEIPQPLGTTIYLYDGGNLLEEVDGSGNVLARYTQELGNDQQLSEFRGAATTYYHADGLGSVTSLSNSTGTTANAYGYDAFGNVTTSTGGIANPFRFTGREFDSETGFYYFRARYYDPVTGRFTSEDPIQIDGGDSNFYAYVGNGSISWVDPDGMTKHRRPSKNPSGRRMSYDEVANVVAHNNRSGQSDELIICLIYKESSFYPRGKNKQSSARGLTGLERGSAREVGVDPNNIYDPATNVRAGTQYLHRRIDWSEPFGSEGDVWEGLYKYGTHEEEYADSILECEKCLQEHSASKSECKTKECLVPLHGGQ